MNNYITNHTCMDNKKTEFINMAEVWQTKLFFKYVDFLLGSFINLCCLEQTVYTIERRFIHAVKTKNNSTDKQFNCFVLVFLLSKV